MSHGEGGGVNQNVVIAMEMPIFVSNIDKSKNPNMKYEGLALCGKFYKNNNIWFSRVRLKALV